MLGGDHRSVHPIERWDSHHFLLAPQQLHRMQFFSGMTTHRTDTGRRRAFAASAYSSWVKTVPIPSGRQASMNFAARALRSILAQPILELQRRHADKDRLRCDLELRRKVADQGEDRSDDHAR